MLCQIKILAIPKHKYNYCRGGWKWRQVLSCGRSGVVWPFQCLRRQTNYETQQNLTQCDILYDSAAITVASILTIYQAYKMYTHTPKCVLVNKQIESVPAYACRAPSPLP